MTWQDAHLVVIVPAAVLTSSRNLGAQMGFTGGDPRVQLSSASDGTTLTHYGLCTWGRPGHVEMFLPGAPVPTIPPGYSYDDIETLRQQWIVSLRYAADGLPMGGAHFNDVLTANGLRWYVPAEATPE